LKRTNPSGLAAGPTNNNSRRFLPSRTALAALALLLFCAGFAQAQEARAAAQGATVDAATRRQIVDAVLRELSAAYVFPETAKAMEKAIRERAARGEYEQITDGQEFARKLTEHLQAVSRDKHLRVNFSAEPLPEGTDMGGPVRIRRTPGDGATPPAGAGGGPVVVRRGPGGGGNVRGLSGDGNAGIEKVERLEGNVGLLEFSLFESLSRVGDKISEAMNRLADTDALIIDLRGNRGGASGTIRLLMSYFFDKPTHLNDYYDRVEDRTDSVYTLAEVPGKRYGDKPVYILTSGRTFSAGESITYSLKNLKRATVVGEATGGGAHPVMPRRLTDHFAVMVPAARYISPVTKTNWEGVGVKPDVEVPAEQALKVAHLAALKRISAADPARAAQLKPVIEKLETSSAQTAGKKN
jgi:hypothetical protein